MARIFIVGSGVVGTATGCGLSQMGHAVTFVDVLESRVDALRADGYDACLGIDLRGEPGSFIFLTLPTPHVVIPAAKAGQPAERRYDLSAFMGGVDDVGRALRDADAVHTVVVRSTVPPKTTSESVMPLLEQLSGKREGLGFSLASNPEFLRAASAYDDFRHPWLTIIGARSKRTGERLADLLRPFGGALRVFDDATTAETIKIVHNVFNATKISFFNEVWGLCNALGVESMDVAGTVALSAEGSWNTSYGINGGAPYGGMCLPKDTNGLLGLARTLGVEMPMLQATITVNENLAAALAARDLDLELTASSEAPDLIEGQSQPAEQSSTSEAA
jgi:UDPglucose 6-dehydrogenase